MFKKIISMGVLLTMLLFSFTACHNNNEIEQYKTDAKYEIEIYAKDKGQENYTTENWEIMMELVAEGKDYINAAKNEFTIVTMVKTAKLAMDEVEPILSKELKDRIKADYLQKFKHELFFGEKLLNKFYGIYNGAAVFFIAGHDTWLKSVTISGVGFNYTSDWKIWVWKDSVFYDLENIEIIFDAGILTQNNLNQIGLIHAETNT